MVAEIIVSVVIAAGTAEPIAFGIRKWLHDERERREEAERRQREENQKREDRMMAEIAGLRTDVAGLRTDVAGLKVSVENTREQRKEDRGEQRAENAATNKRIDNLEAKVDGLAEGVTSLGAQFATFRDIVTPHMLPASRMPE